VGRWRKQDWLIHSACCLQYTAMSAQQFLAAKNVAVSPPPLPPYTSDLTPCYFFFPRMKSEPRGRCSWDVPEIQEQLLIGLRMTPASQLQRCLQEQQKLNNIYIYIYIYTYLFSYRLSRGIFNKPFSVSLHGPGWRSRYSDSLRAGEARDRFPVEARFSPPVLTGPGANPSTYTMSTGSPPLG